MIAENKAEMITKQFKQIVGMKYNIIEIKLFGSSARDDYAEDSDIDIYIKLETVTREIEEELFNIAYDLELEHDCIIDVIVAPEIMNNIPLYQKIEKEGIAI
jgi:predicted nucleotidyltransferase